ncbi:MAG: hypothetical protein ABIR18_06950 [Chitinophagaceae bacterium]
MTEGMFLALWTKYLPIIRILLKKAGPEEQKLAVGKLELQSVDNRKNANYSFELEIANGRVEKGIGSKAISKDLFIILNNDPTVRSLMPDKIITISMGKSLQLSLKMEPITVTTE